MKNRILTISFLAITFGMFILGIVIPDKEISASERRKLKQFPKLTIEDVFSPDYYKALDDYFVDQVPFREGYRMLKGLFNNEILKNPVENETFIIDDSIYQLNTKVDMKSVEHLIKVIKKIESDYVSGDSNIYYSIIPDKNYYLENTKIPRLDYEKITDTFDKSLDYQYINLFEALDSNSFYRTDIHWKQEELGGVLTKVSEGMDLKNIEMPKDVKVYDRFFGSLYSRIPNRMEPDTLKFLGAESLSHVRVYNFEKDAYEGVYEDENLSNIDSYDIFLSGASPILVIENDEASVERELVMFRDSFSSSLAPLLINAYSKITLLDLRYIGSEKLDEIGIDFFSNNPDIYFIYGIELINNSYTIS